MGTDAQVRPSAGETALSKAMGLAATVNEKNIIRLMVPIQNAGDPTNAITPDFIGQLCADTSGNKLYYASTAASSGWLVLN